MSYKNTFIAVAADTKASSGAVPPSRRTTKSVALLEYELIAANPYRFTQEEVQFETHLRRLGLNPEEIVKRRSALWFEFFSRPRACMRASPLPKSYGWGVHFDGEGRVALVAVESKEYARLLRDSTLQQVAAMRNRRA